MTPSGFDIYNTNICTCMNIEKIQQVIEDLKHNIKITLPLPAEILITSIRLILIVGLLSATDDGLIYLLLKAYIRRGFFFSVNTFKKIIIRNPHGCPKSGGKRLSLDGT